MSAPAGWNYGKGRYAAVFGPGRYVNEKGYLRYSSGKLRGRYHHRVVMAALCAEFCFYPLSPQSGLPDGFSVEHIDHNRTHNCPANLLLLDELLHNFISSHSEQFRAKLMRREYYFRALRQEAADSEVPF